MKTGYKILTIFLLSTLGSLAQSKAPGDSAFCLELLGKVYDPDKDKLPDCHVELFDGLDLVDSLCIKEDVKKFNFFLKRNRSYALRISMNGYVSQLISVNTDFPADIVDICPFSFNTKLVSVRKAETLNRDALDFPIAIIYFDQLTEGFVHNESYTQDIKSEIGIADTGSNKKGSKKKNSSGSILKNF